MIIYSPLFVNHFRTLSEWARETGAEVQLDCANFELKVSWRNRFFFLFAQFVGMPNGRYAYLPTLTPDVTGFIGWLPYRPFVYALSRDKLTFKRHAQTVGLPTPQFWLAESLSDISADYVLKRSTGSFGYQLSGPFKQALKPDQQVQPQESAGDLYAEQFIRGKILKVWFWGMRAFFAQCHSYPVVIGDGQSTARKLVEERLKTLALSWDTCTDRSAIESCLSYQGRGMDDTVAAGECLFIDYRYSRDYQPPKSALVSDNQLALLSQPVRDQIAAAGVQIKQALMTQVTAPVLYALDGVLDEQDRVWWLEMNSNPLLPPEGYHEMFQDLFAV